MDFDLKLDAAGDPRPRTNKELQNDLAAMCRDPAFSAYCESGPSLLRQVIAALAHRPK